MADWVSDECGAGGESVGDGCVAGGYYGDGVCGRGVVWDDSAGGDSVGGGDGGGEVWGFLWEGWVSGEVRGVRGGGGLGRERKGKVAYFVWWWGARMGKAKVKGRIAWCGRDGAKGENWGA